MMIKEMSYTEFVHWIAKNLPRAMGSELEGCQIRIEQVSKMQDDTFLGIRILPKGSVMALGLDMRSAYQEYNRHGKEEACIWQVVQAVERCFDESPEIVAGELTDFSIMKKKIMMQLVSTKKNEKFLKTIPHHEWEDLSVIYRIILDEKSDKAYSMVVTNELLERFGMDEEELYQWVLREAPKNFPAQIHRVHNMLVDMGKLWDILGQEAIEHAEDIMIVTTDNALWGASCMFYPGLLEKMAELIGGSFYVIPSSIHEMIMTRDNGYYKEEHLKELIREVNRVEVRKEDFLSDSLYYYNAEIKLFHRIGE